VIDREDLQTKAADLVKKILTVGVGAIFLTEESLRALVTEMKLPKELLTGVLQSAAKTKNDFLSKLSSDILERVTNKIEPGALISEFLLNHELDFNIRLNFKPKKKD
jgi:hypothetical protein